MKKHLILLHGLILALFLCPMVRAADDTPINTREAAEQLISNFKYQKGHIVLNGGLAEVNIPDGFRFLGPEDAQAVLVRLWHNPPGPLPLGMLMPEQSSPIDPDTWAVTINYLEEGHVKDDDAQKIDYTALLSKMQKEVLDENKARLDKGYPTMQLVGWARPPRYDAATHKLYWAKEINFAGQSENTLNYNIRVLGRKGVLLLNVIAPMNMLPEVEKSAPQIIAMVDFQPGNRYADYDSSTDKLATYGIAALVAGGVAAKLGLFKIILTALAAAWKPIAIAFAAIGSRFKRLFKKKDNPLQIGTGHYSRIDGECN